MENPYFKRIIQFFEENCNSIEIKPIFLFFEENYIWDCADKIIMTEYGGQFIHMIEENFTNLQPHKVKSFLLLVLEITRNPILYKETWSIVLKNVDYFDSLEFKKNGIYCQSPI